MPKRLLDRCAADSIREFRASAQLRFDEALLLAGWGRRTAAIYLWGYTAEMTLKAAYFALVGFDETRPILWPDLQAAVNLGRASGIHWPKQGAGHNIRAWAELLVTVRIRNPAWVYASPSFGNTVQRMGQRFEPLWRETLRYHKNTAYLYEMNQIREAAEWLITHSGWL